MNDIEKRIFLAQQNNKELDRLLVDYLPFIKKQLSNMNSLGLEFDDMLSIAMFTFVNCIRQYSENRGSFLSFATVSIKNRIIDESRKQQKYSAKIISLYPNDRESATRTIDETAAIAEYSKEQERQNLSDEIDMLSAELSVFDIKFSELTNICPKQDRARKQCIEIARAVNQIEVMRNNLKINHRLFQTELAKQFNISPKTIEKHRKYIVTIALLLMGDYPSIKAFLPQYKGVR